MQHDEVIWQVIRHNHCSYMAKIETGNFCRNPYNVTGTCNRSSCPLANSRYATIRDHDGVFYLYMKTIERAHMPNKLWERVKLPRNYANALEIIDKHLIYWPKLLVHKTKQRLTKMTQMRIRMRKLVMKTREKIMTVPTKQKKKEERNEKKAEKAALVENAIRKELCERLTNRVYDQNDMYIDIINKELGMEPNTEIEDEEEGLIEYVEGYDELEEEDDIEDFAGFGIGHDDDDDNVDLDDDEDHEEQNVFFDRKRGKKDSAGKIAKEEPPSKPKKKAKVHVEVEHEDANERQRAVQ